MSSLVMTYLRLAGVDGGRWWVVVGGGGGGSELHLECVRRQITFVVHD